jgi:ribonuclease Z
MKQSFHPRLINDPFSDPGLFIPLLFQKRALLFDLGDMSCLSPRDILKISHAFVTHTHMDHFIGFDTLLRLLLGRDKEIHLFGPYPFLKHVEAKLNSYTWNLVENYESILSFRVTEIQGEKALVQRYESRNRFEPADPPREFPFSGRLLTERSFTVDAAVFDHKVDCLGLSLKEHFSINIIKEKLKELGLPVGPWLTRFKRAIHEGSDPSGEFKVSWQDEAGVAREERFALGRLSEKIARISPGQKITYITDIIGSPENIARAVELAMDSDRLFIEAAFLEADKDMARHKYHLTAREAGLIAARARVKELSLFHYSPRYFGREKELHEEAMAAFRSGA